jgi:hypothetical protein
MMIIVGNAKRVTIKYSWNPASFDGGGIKRREWPKRDIDNLFLRELVASSKEQKATYRG